MEITKEVVAEVAKKATVEATKSVSESVETLKSEMLENQKTLEAELDTAKKTLAKMQKSAMAKNNSAEAKRDLAIKLFADGMKAMKNGNTEAIKKINAQIVEKGLAKGTATAGGFLVPVEFSREIIRQMPKFGTARRLFRSIPMQTDTLSVNALSGEPIAGMVGEGMAIAETDLAFAQKNLLAKKMACYVVSTYELIEDNQADIEIWNLVIERVALAFAKEEDNQIFLGDGTGENITGFMTTPVTDGASEISIAIADLNWDTLLDLTGTLEDDVAEDGAFVLSRTMYHKLMKLKDDNGAYLHEKAWLEASTEDKKTGIIGYAWGFPVYIARPMPSAVSAASGDRVVAFGNFRLAGVIGDRAGLRVNKFNEQIGAVNLSEKDLEALRVIKRFGFETVYPKALGFIKLA